MDKFSLGYLLAISSTILIGISFVFQKKGLLRSGYKGTRASQGGYGYLNDYLWWLGMILMASGEILNFTAYSFAPASLVTPLGAISVLVTAISSSIFLQEHLNVVSKIGCMLCLCGSTMIVIHAPKEKELNFSIIYPVIYGKEFILYSILIVSLGVFIILFIAPRWGGKTPLVYILISGGFGSLTVICCKIFGIALLERVFPISYSKESVAFTLPSINPVKIQASPLLLISFLLIIIVLLVVQLNFLNRALDIFNVSIVTTLLYVVFTSLVLISSSIIFSEMSHQNFSDFMGILVGFFTIIFGIILINCFQMSAIVDSHKQIGFMDLFRGNMSFIISATSTNTSPRTTKTLITKSSSSSFEIA